MWDQEVELLQHQVEVQLGARPPMRPPRKKRKRRKKKVNRLMSPFSACELISVFLVEKEESDEDMGFGLFD